MSSTSFDSQFRDPLPVHPPEVRFKKGTFVTAQKDNGSGKARASIDFEEFVVCLALCGHVKYERVEGMSLAARVSAIMENYLGQKDELTVVSAAVVKKVERFNASSASPLPGQALAQHSLFIETWKALDLSKVVGFPAWEKSVFDLFQPIFADVSGIFYKYAMSIDGPVAASASLSETMQENELASLVRDTGLATEAFPIGRIHTLYKSVATNDQLTLPGFVNLLLLIAVHRANPKFGTVGKADASSISSPLPGCLDSILKKNILKSKKQEKQAAVKKEVKTLDTGKLFKASRDKLKKGFDDACKAREKGRSLFGSLVMSKANLVLECKERGLLGQRSVKEDGKDVMVELAAADVERAFVSCQDGQGGDEGADTINFDEFLTCLAILGNIKFEDVSSMSTGQRVEALVANFLGVKDEKALVKTVKKKAAVADVPRYDASGAIALPGQGAAEHDKFMSSWKKLDLSHVEGFPTWEEEIFHILQQSFTDLLSIFTYYACAGEPTGSTWGGSTLQQTELVDLALDCGLATKALPMNKLVKLFEEENSRFGAGDQDLELHEFLQLVVVVAYKRANPTGKEGVALGEALEKMISKHLSRTTRLSELQPLMTSLKNDVATNAVLKVHEAALRNFYMEGMPERAPNMPEQAFLRQLNMAGLMKGAIVPLPSEALDTLPKGSPSEVRCDLLWLDVSAAFHCCASSEAGLFVADYASCLALCGMIKYSSVTSMSTVQRVAGFLANLAGRMDEADVVKTAFSRGSPRGVTESATPAQVESTPPPAPKPSAAPLSGAGAGVLEAAPAPAASKPKATPLKDASQTPPADPTKKKPPSPRSAGGAGKKEDAKPKGKDSPAGARKGKESPAGARAGAPSADKPVKRPSSPRGGKKA